MSLVDRIINEQYFLIYMGDEPESEKRSGPFKSFADAKLCINSYHASKKECQHKFMSSWNGQIDSTFIIWNCNRLPTYQDCIERMKP